MLWCFKIKYSAELQFDLAHTDRIDVNFPFNEEDNDSMIAYKLASLNQEVIAETIQLIVLSNFIKLWNYLIKTKMIRYLWNRKFITCSYVFPHKRCRYKEMTFKDAR